MTNRIARLFAATFLWSMVGAGLMQQTTLAQPPPADSTIGLLLITDFDEHTVLVYDRDTGGFVGEFVPRKEGGLNYPTGILFGPHDQNLYVSSGSFGGMGELTAICRYDGTTGPFVDVFAEDALVSPRGIIFGPDGHLYVADRPTIGEGRILRYHGTTGELLDEFVPTSSDGLSNPVGLVFGPSGSNPNRLDLYVTSTLANSIARYDGETGAYLGDFVKPNAHQLDHPIGLIFGPDGNLYVANWAAGSGHLAVLRFEGPAGKSPGAPLPSLGNSGADFVPPGSGGLLAPAALLFGPDANGDGHLDLYVAGSSVNGALKSNKHSGSVKRYDGVTGAFIDTFVPVDSGGLRSPFLMTFTETDPVTLKYLGD